jgi:hypothetical protein
MWFLNYHRIESRCTSKALLRDSLGKYLASYLILRVHTSSFIPTSHLDFLPHKGIGLDFMLFSLQLLVVYLYCTMIQAAMHRMADLITPNPQNDPLKIQTNGEKYPALVLHRTHSCASLCYFLKAAETSARVHSAMTSPSYTSLLIVKILSSTFS